MILNEDPNLALLLILKVDPIETISSTESIPPKLEVFLTERVEPIET
jgi:hypothetical protein